MTDRLSKKKKEKQKQLTRLQKKWVPTVAPEYDDF